MLCGTPLFICQDLYSAVLSKPSISEQGLLAVIHSKQISSKAIRAASLEHTGYSLCLIACSSLQLADKLAVYSCKTSCLSFGRVCAFSSLPNDFLQRRAATKSRHLQSVIPSKTFNDGLQLRQLVIHPQQATRVQKQDPPSPPIARVCLDVVEQPVHCFP